MPSQKQFEKFKDWHWKQAKSKPNKPHRIKEGWYFYWMQEDRFHGMFEIRHEYDEDDGHEIGWYVSKYNGYAGDPLSTLKECLEYLKSSEINI